MKAHILVRAVEYSIWEGFDDETRQETTYAVGVGEFIETVGLGLTYRFEVVDVRPGAVDLYIRPGVVLHPEGQERGVGALTIEVGKTVTLQTLSFDAWGNWLVTLEGVV